MICRLFLSRKNWIEFMVNFWFNWSYLKNLKIRKLKKKTEKIDHENFLHSASVCSGLRNYAIRKKRRFINWHDLEDTELGKYLHVCIFCFYFIIDKIKTKNEIKTFIWDRQEHIFFTKKQIHTLSWLHRNSTWTVHVAYFWSQSSIRLLLIDYWIWCDFAQIA